MRKDIRYHRRLLADQARTGGFRQAIFARVRPGDVVLDLGAGTGILAYFACQAGARRVYAVEAGAIIDVAQEVCRCNGFQDRVVLLRGSSTRIELPERVDVVVSDTFDNFALGGGLLGLMLDARRRFLKDGGAVIPHSVRLMAAPVEAADYYAENIEFWRTKLNGIDLSPVRSLVVNDVHLATFADRACLSDPMSLVHLDFQQPVGLFVRGTATFAVRRAGTLHGIGGWFEAELARGIEISNGPTARSLPWAHYFLPLQHPVVVAKDSRVAVTIATHDGEQWRWQVVVSGSSEGADQPPTGMSFDQSTFWSLPWSRDILEKHVATSKPALSRLGEAEQFLLTFFDGRTPLVEMERLLLAQYKGLFSSAGEAARFVADVAARCGS